MRTAAGSVPDRYQSFVKTKELYQNWLGNSVAKANYFICLKCFLFEMLAMSRKYVNMNTREDSRPQWVKISEVAAMYGTKPQTVRSWIRKVLLKQTGIGRRLQ